MNTYWLSFVKDGKNAGCCIIDADNPENAVIESRALGINPGGEVAVFELGPDPDAEDLKWGKNKLIHPRFLEQDGYQKTGERFVPDDRVTIICEECNEI